MIALLGGNEQEAGLLPILQEDYQLVPPHAACGEPGAHEKDSACRCRCSDIVAVSRLEAVLLDGFNHRRFEDGPKPSAPSSGYRIYECAFGKYLTQTMGAMSAGNDHAITK